jgi:hypothetical protein
LSGDLKLEASKAIFRELRHIKLLVDLPFEFLSFEKSALQVQTFILCALRESACTVSLFTRVRRLGKRNSASSGICWPHLRRAEWCGRVWVGLTGLFEIKATAPIGQHYEIRIIDVLNRRGFWFDCLLVQ